MKRNTLLITRSDLLEFMSEENYELFIKRIGDRTFHVDYDNIKSSDSIWIIAEWSGGFDE